jgi:hypothetical protein
MPQLSGQVVYGLSVIAREPRALDTGLFKLYFSERYLREVDMGDLFRTLAQEEEDLKTRDPRLGPIRYLLYALVELPRIALVRDQAKVSDYVSILEICMNRFDAFKGMSDFFEERGGPLLRYNPPQACDPRDLGGFDKGGVCENVLPGVRGTGRLTGHSARRPEIREGEIGGDVPRAHDARSARSEG